MVERDFKRVAVISDLHSGHRVGLTPPQFDFAEPNDRWFLIRRELWGKYTRIIDSIKPIDILIVNGDSIEGKGERSGGTEIIEADRRKQCLIAKECIRYTESPIIRATYGTPYHVGKEEDWESILIEDMLGGKIGSHEWIDVNGTVFDFKHKVGSSSVPYGRATQPAKERLWNLLWSEHEEQPKSDVIIRSHVHYCFDVGEAFDWRAFTTPALQGQGSKFGGRQCSGTVHWGLLWFDCYNGGGYEWSGEVYRAKYQKRTAEKL